MFYFGERQSIERLAQEHFQKAYGTLLDIGVLFVVIKRRSPAGV